MNTRRDDHLDAMLRHVGAAYYDSLHGRATKADVARAVHSYEDGLGEQPGEHAARATRPHRAAAWQQPRRARLDHGPWPHRVRDVMTTSVITVDRITPFKEIAGLLTQAVFVGMHRPGNVGLGGPAVQGIVIGGTNVPQHGIEVIVAAGVHGVPPSRPPGQWCRISPVPSHHCRPGAGRAERHRPLDLRPFPK